MGRQSPSQPPEDVTSLLTEAKTLARRIVAIVEVLETDLHREDDHEQT